MAEYVLAQLAREPIPGQVKTRMTPFLTAERAADLHGAMVRHIAAKLCRLGALELWVAGDANAAFFRDCQQLGNISLHEQAGGDLGARMQHIVDQGLSRADKVILVGSDVPGLDTDYIEQAVAALDHADAVLGPAEDGGYVLVGLAQRCDAIFNNMPWGTETVLARTLAALEESGLTRELLSSLPDVDRPEDLRHLPEALHW